MKFLTLLGSRLTLYYRKNKLLFLLFCIGGILSALAFLYFYGNYIPWMTNRDSSEFYYRDFRLFNDAQKLPDGFSAAALQEIGDDPMVQTVTMIHIEQEDWNTPVAANLGIDPSVVRMMGKISFENAGPYSVIVPENRSELKVGDTWEFLGKEFTVIGVHVDGNFIIPIETYRQLGLSTEVATVYAAKKSDVDSGAMLAKLRDAFPSAEIGAPEIGEIYDTALSLREIRNLAISYTAVIIAFLFLFYQMVSDTAKETAIFRIVGATGTEIGLLHFWEVFLLSAGSFLVGILLHIGLYPGLLSKLNRMEGIRYSTGDYLLVLFLMTSITLAVSIPYVLRSVRLSPYSARRQTL